MSEFEDLIPEFVEESLDHLKHIEEDIIQIEQGQADDELINSVFRAVHSVKGGSSFLGLKNIEKLSHKMEDIFNLVRNGNLEFTPKISTKVLTSIDKLKEMLEDSGDSDNYDISSNVHDMEAVINNDSSASTTEEISVEGFDSKVNMSKYKYDNFKKKGQKVYLIRKEFVECDQYNNILELLKEVRKTGELVENLIDIEFVMSGDNFSGDGIPLKIIYASVLDKDLVAHTFGIDGDDLVELKEENIIDEEKKEIKEKKAEKVEKIPEKKETPADIKINEPIEEEEDEEEDIEAIEDENEFMTFLIGDEEYGIGIKLIQEIVTMQSITGIPDSEDSTKGIINLRGDILPVYDFRLKLEFEGREYDKETIILIVNMEEKKFGIIVDRISEVILLKRTEIKDAPNMKNIPSSYVIGIGQKDDKFIILLKVKEIILGNNAA